MDKLKIILGQWQKLMTKYDQNSMKLQRKISDIIKKEWSTSNTRSQSDLKSFIERAGLKKISKTILSIFQKNSRQKPRRNSADQCLHQTHLCVKLRMIQKILIQIKNSKALKLVVNQTKIVKMIPLKVRLILTENKLKYIRLFYCFYLHSPLNRFRRYPFNDKSIENS